MVRLQNDNMCIRTSIDLFNYVYLRTCRHVRVADLSIIITVTDDMQCFVRKYLTDDGHTFYDVGCKDSQACATINHVGKRENKEIDTSPFNQTFEDSFNPTVICEKCCQSDLCNVDSLCSSTHCVSDPADIVFLLDESGSIGTRNFDIELKFIAEFAKHYTIGPNDVQMGVISFTTRVTEHFTLNDYANINDLTRGISSIHYHGGGTRTDLAIDYALKNSFSSGNGARSNVPHFLIVISDGNSNYPHLTDAAAARLHKTNINIFAVGVGSVNLVELNTIASSRTNHVLTVHSHLELNLPLKAIRCRKYNFTEAITYI
ncbi:COL6A [Mytilus coruscus]|uniref:COL6A n=1 Tax=Mytilus coruscus TaxID=42192 RepID=A0A6J8DKV7_MYTCO|nr:COL6A [Mytilus coruscus]